MLAALDLDKKMRMEVNALDYAIGGVVKHSLHQGGSPQNGLRDEQTCEMTLASAYVLHCLSTIWSQLQMIGRSSR